MNGAVASNTRELRPAFRQVPLTGGEKVGTPSALETGPDRLTVTTWSEGTSVAPAAGVVDATVNGTTGVVEVVGVLPDGAAVPDVGE